MPLMKLACTALERVPLTRPKIIEHLMKKFNQDLVFCRAPEDNDLTSGVYGMPFINLKLYSLFVSLCMYLCTFSLTIELLPFYVNMKLNCNCGSLMMLTLALLVHGWLSIKCFLPNFIFFFQIVSLNGLVILFLDSTFTSWFKVEPCCANDWCMFYKSGTCVIVSTFMLCVLFECIYVYALSII